MNTTQSLARAHASDADGLGTASARPSIALVIPALNEAATIRNVVARALNRVDRVIVVDDGSCDDTSRSLQGLPIVVLRNDRTSGKAASLRRGMSYALDKGASAVVTLDGDGQHAPEDISRLMAAHRQHPDTIVIGARLHETAKIPRRRYLANRFANFWIAWAAGYPLHDSQSGFRLYPGSVVRRVAMKNRSHGFVFESEILIDAARAGVKSVSVTIPAVYRPDARPSHFRPVHDIVLITRMVAWKLLSRGLYPLGLIRSLRRSSQGHDVSMISSATDTLVGVPPRKEPSRLSGADYSEVSSGAERG
jgi:glycosyltransferase involved in cell wall biosynthesis